LFLPRLKLKKDVFCRLFFGFDLFRHVVLQPNRGMQARICRPDVGKRATEAWMPIVARSVKAGMTK
ncbi:hypothetical protein L7I36_11515, partial [Obesumbacterium proteus]|uniref:hypothetical protein n=1 Tax=Obesumbacterium proteus TaxID=82983 RepID=UPI001EDAACA8